MASYRNIDKYVEHFKRRQYMPGRKMIVVGGPPVIEMISPVQSAVKRAKSQLEKTTSKKAKSQPKKKYPVKVYKKTQKTTQH